HAQALPHAVTEDEARVEHGHDSPLTRDELAVDPDENALVARVVLEVVRAVGHRAEAYARTRNCGADRASPERTSSWHPQAVSASAVGPVQGRPSRGPHDTRNAARNL